MCLLPGLLPWLLQAALLLPEAPPVPPSPVPPSAPCPAADRAVEAPRARPDEAPGPAAATLPWQLDTSYRYVWIRGSAKVGETRFELRRPIKEKPEYYELRSSRSYDYERTSQRAQSVTRFLEDGTPLEFEESLDFSTINNLRAHQDTRISFEGGKARLRYVQQGRDQSPALHEVEMPPRTFLFASQAADHWAMFAARIPVDTETHEMKLLYPDFLRVLTVNFRKKGPENLRLKGESVPTVRYYFRSDEGQLEGSIWVDSKRRLVQIEFPGGAPASSPLRVILAPD